MAGNFPLAPTPCWSILKLKSKGLLMQFISLLIGFRDNCKTCVLLCINNDKIEKTANFKHSLQVQKGNAFVQITVSEKTISQFLWFMGNFPNPQIFSQTKDQECEAALHVIHGCETSSDLSFLVLSLLTLS